MYAPSSQGSHFGQIRHEDYEDVARNGIDQTNLTFFGYFEWLYLAVQGVKRVSFLFFLLFLFFSRRFGSGNTGNVLAVDRCTLWVVGLLFFSSDSHA